jgi:hypothetical protein
MIAADATTPGEDSTMTLEEILQDIHGLDARLQELERQYGLLSEDMYTLYRLGELEQSRDLIRWVGYYELRQERRHAYEAALRERLLAWRNASPGLPMSLQPRLTLLAEA